MWGRCWWQTSFWAIYLNWKSYSCLFAISQGCTNNLCSALFIADGREITLHGGAEDGWVGGRWVVLVAPLTYRGAWDICL